MVGKEIEPSDIGKHPKVIKAAQVDLTLTDVLVCGRCHSVFHFIELFKEHKDEGCDKDSTLRDCRETKSKVWAFLLWKASQLNSNDSSDYINSWKLYQTWVKMDETIRETWVVAGKTIQSFARMGQGSLQEMPVKITKTVVDNALQTNKVINSRMNDSRVNKKDDDDDSTIKSEPIKVVRKTVGTPVNHPARPLGNTAATLNRSINRRANRTLPNTSSQEFEEETVEKIIAKRFNPRRKMHEYLVKWEGFPHDQNTWEPQTHLECCPQLLETFEKQLARQKEQRAAQAAKQAAALAAAQQQQQQQQQQLANQAQQQVSPSGRPSRNSKARALDQVKQWCADEETNSSNGTKRKHDESDFEDNPGEIGDEDLEEEVIPIHAVKRVRNGNTVSIKTETKPDIKINQIPTTIIKAVNGTIRNSTLNESSAEVVIIKDSQGSGIVRKPGVTITSSHKNEAQIRVLSKGENTQSGIVRINAAQLSSTQKTPVTIVTSTSSVTPSGNPPSTRITQVIQRGNQSSTPSATSGQAQISQVQTHRIVMNPKESVTIKSVQQPRTLPTKVSSANPVQSNRLLQNQTKSVVQRTSMSPSNQSNLSPSSGKMIINRVVRNSAVSKAVTPEQKIFQLSKSGDLKVTRTIISNSPQQQQTQQQHQHRQQSPQTISITKNEEIDSPLSGDAFTERESPPRPLTLCPVTGKVLGQPEEEQQSSPSPDKKDSETNSQNHPQSGIFHTQPPNIVEQQQQQQQQQDQEELTGTLTLTTADGQTQQLLTSEDGTPLLVTGEDGTIYQVAGKNAEGQTILIAQGTDEDQHFAYVATEDGEEGSVLAIDNAVAEAVAQMLPEQQEALAAAAAASGGEAQFIIKQDDGNTTVTTADGSTDATQTLTIQTSDGDSQDANIPAEVVQADQPSPGGTRRVVLLLQDGTFMMTEMHDDEYQALNLVT